MRSLRDRLQAAAAQPIHRRPTRFDRQPGHQTNSSRNIEPLLALLLRIAQDHIFNRSRIDAASLNERAHYHHSQVIGADIAKNTLLRMGPANRRATGIDNYGSFHSFKEKA